MALQDVEEPVAASQPPAAPASAPAQPEKPKRVTYTREQLYEAVWSTPVTKLAAELCANSKIATMSSSPGSSQYGGLQIACHAL